MNRTVWKNASLVLIVACALLGRVEAQQSQGGVQALQEQMGEETQEMPAQSPLGLPITGMMQQMQGMMQQMQGMMQQMYSGMGRDGMQGFGMAREREGEGLSDGKGMMGHGGMMMRHGGIVGHMQHQLGRLAHQLDLSDEQQVKVQALLLVYAKEGIGLKADIDTTRIDLQQLLEAQPIDMAKVKTTLQAVAGKEAELRLAHIAAMQEIRKLLTPEQQKQFHTVWGHMMSGGGKMAHGGMMDRGGLQKHRKQMGHGGMQGHGGMKHPCGMPRGKSEK